MKDLAANYTSSQTASESSPNTAQSSSWKTAKSCQQLNRFVNTKSTNFQIFCRDLLIEIFEKSSNVALLLSEHSESQTHRERVKYCWSVYIPITRAPLTFANQSELPTDHSKSKPWKLTNQNTGLSLFDRPIFRRQLRPIDLPKLAGSSTVWNFSLDYTSIGILTCGASRQHWNSFPSPHT